MRSLIKIKKIDKKLTPHCKKVVKELERFKKEQQYRADFVANAIHDLKNPLTSIQGYIDYMLSEKIGNINPKQKRALKTSRDSVNNLKNIISRILLVYKLESHKEKADLNNIDLEKLLTEIYEQEKIIFEKKKVELYLDIKKPIPLVQADYNKIKEAIINLVDNAYKFTNKGSVTIFAKKYGKNDVELAVEDTGMGIPKNKVRFLFRRFSQMSEESRNKYGGLGLGLVIVKEILKLHKSEIRLDTELGKGSKFSFILKGVNKKVKK